MWNDAWMDWTELDEMRLVATIAHIKSATVVKHSWSRGFTRCFFRSIVRFYAFESTSYRFVCLVVFFRFLALFFFATCIPAAAFRASVCISLWLTLLGAPSMSPASFTAVASCICTQKQPVMCKWAWFQKAIDFQKAFMMCLGWPTLLFNCKSLKDIERPFK